MEDTFLKIDEYDAEHGLIAYSFKTKESSERVCDLLTPDRVEYLVTCRIQDVSKFEVSEKINKEDQRKLRSLLGLL